MSYKINHQERQALKGLPHLPRLIYLEALRPYMDYQTGIVGLQRGISHQSIAEELYIEPHPGYQSGSPSKDQIRRALKSLEKSGIIQLKSMNKKLILFCCLAEQDNFAQNKAATKAPYQPATPKPHFSQENKADFSIKSSKGTTSTKPEAATPPVSGYINTPSLAKQASKISVDFQPSLEVLEKAKQHGCPFDNADEFTKFICHHQARGTHSHDWNADFLRWLMRAKQYHEEKKHASHQRANRQAQSISAVERVIRAYQCTSTANPKTIYDHETGYCMAVGEND